MLTNQEFIKQAKNEIYTYICKHTWVSPDFSSLDDKVLVVWQCKTLQNYKALLFSPLYSNYYFEATYNGDNCELYIDVYYKKENIVIKSSGRQVYRLSDNSSEAIKKLAPKSETDKLVDKIISEADKSEVKKKVDSKEVYLDTEPVYVKPEKLKEDTDGDRPKFRVVKSYKRVVNGKVVDEYHYDSNVDGDEVEYQKKLKDGKKCKCDPDGVKCDPDGVQSAQQVAKPAKKLAKEVASKEVTSKQLAKKLANKKVNKELVNRSAKAGNKSKNGSNDYVSLDATSVGDIVRFPGYRGMFLVLDHMRHKRDDGSECRVITKVLGLNPVEDVKWGDTCDYWTNGISQVVDKAGDELEEKLVHGLVDTRLIRKSEVKEYRDLLLSAKANRTAECWFWDGDRSWAYDDGDEEVDNGSNKGAKKQVSKEVAKSLVWDFEGNVERVNCGESHVVRTMNLVFGDTKCLVVKRVGE